MLGNDLLGRVEGVFPIFAQAEHGIVTACLPDVLNEFGDERRIDMFDCVKPETTCSRLLQNPFSPTEKILFYVSVSMVD
jgi:hypothetical protein